MEVEPMNDGRLEELRYWPDYLWREEYTEELYDEIVRLRALVRPVTHAAPYRWMGDTYRWKPYSVWRRNTAIEGKFAAFCGAPTTRERTSDQPTCKKCIAQLADRTERDRSIYVPECNGFAFQEHIDISEGKPCREPRCRPSPCQHCVNPTCEEITQVHTK